MKRKNDNDSQEQERNDESGRREQEFMSGTSAPIIIPGNFQRTKTPRHDGISRQKLHFFKLSPSPSTSSTAATTSPAASFPPLSAETEWEDDLRQAGLITDIETGERAAECAFGGDEEDGQAIMSGALPAEDVRCLVSGGAAKAGEGNE